MKLVTLEAKTKLNETRKGKKTQGTVEMLLLALLLIPFFSPGENEVIIWWCTSSEGRFTTIISCTLFTRTPCFRDMKKGQEWAIRDICSGGICFPQHDGAGGWPAHGKWGVDSLFCLYTQLLVYLLKCFCSSHELLYIYPSNSLSSHWGGVTK